MTSRNSLQPHRKKSSARPASESKWSTHPVILRPADSLTAWFNQYVSQEAGANAANTFKAKSRDIELFLQFFADKIKSDHPDDWTKSITAAFLRQLETTPIIRWGKEARRKPATANRVLATLRHAGTWIHERRSFLAGNPCRGIRELVQDEPAWKGLSDIEVMRLRSASEQIAVLKTRRNQHAARDRAIFMVLLHTGLRISELLALNRDQCQGKHFTDVRRKGKVRTARVFLPPDARDALDTYIKEVRRDQVGPLFTTGSGVGLERQHVDRLLKQLAAQASSKLPKDEQVRLSAHVLRHTFLRRVTEKHGVQFAMEAAGHASSKYIWRYVKPSEEQREKALEDLF